MLDYTRMEEPVIPVGVISMKEETNPLEISDLKTDEEIVDIAISPVTQSSQSVRDNNNSRASATLAYNLDTYLSERRLLRLVRKQPALYSRRHRRFNDDAYKDQLWQRIAQQLSIELTKCLSVWAALRYNYQRHVRRLRVYCRQTQAGRGEKRPRPTMLHEEDMLFLYPHVSRQPVLCEKPDNGHDTELASVDDDVTIVPMQPVDIIDLDAVDCEQFKISADQQRLIDAVRAYPQLYDTAHVGYGNYRHRGIIWGAISNELREKATKLMKVWLQLKTRYEWELLHDSGASSQLMEQLSFLAPHIRNTPGTVCKMSFYLQDSWFDPIEHFRSVMNLINVLKTLPELAQMVDDYEHSEQKPNRYNELWLTASAVVKCSNQRCEVTWLMLRNFYLELAEMRKVGYQLQDKWFFENIIGCLYKVVALRSARRAQKRNASTLPIGGSPPKIKSPVSLASVASATPQMPVPYHKVPPKPASNTPQLVPPLPLAIVYPAAATRAPSMGTTITAITSSSNISTSITTSITANSITINSNSCTNGITASTPAFTLPRITAAISVVPKPPANAAAATAAAAAPTPNSGFMNLIPKPLALPIPATVQLASVSGVLASPMRTGLQVLVRPKLRLPVSPVTTTTTTTTTTTKTVTALPAHPPAGTTIRAITPASAGAFIQALTPTAKVANMANMLATLSPSPTPNGMPLPTVGPPLPKLVPLTVRNDKVTLPSSGVLPRPWATYSSSASSALSPATTTPSQMPPLTATTYVRKHQNALNSGWDDIPNPPTTIKCIKIAASGPPKLAMAKTMPLPSPSPSQDDNEIEFHDCSQSGRVSMAKTAPSLDDIKVEFRDCLITGRVVYADGRVLPFPSILNMSRTAVFIREVMAVPQLHSSEPYLAAKGNHFWQQISKKVHEPEQACRAMWAFLVKHMNQFPKIAPMDELMRPFKTTLKVWEKSHRLFSKFDEIARKYQWMLHRKKLPALMQHFEKYDHLYWELRRPRPGESAQSLRPPRHYSDKECQEVWRVARERFPHMNHRDVWSMFKFAFKTYMEDLERGIENPWPQNWWHALEQLKFLVNVRYHPLEPYYYIVHNKFVEEVKRCTMYEALMQPSRELAPSKVIDTPATMPWETEEAKRLLAVKAVNASRALNAELEQLKKQQQLWEKEKHQEELELDLVAEEENMQQQQQQQQQSSAEAELRLETRPTVNELVKHMAGDYRRLPNMDAFQLTRLLRCHPKTFGKASTMEKRSAWQHVAKQLNATVTDCRLSLQHALRELRILKISDINCRCVLSQKYYYHMDEIYKQVKIGGQVLVRTPHQLNRTLMQPTETIYPERYLPEINMITCNASLVVKNWAYAVSNLPSSSQDDIRIRLRQIFAKYASLANIEWPKVIASKRPNGALHQHQQQQQQQLAEKRPKLEKDT